MNLSDHELIAAYALDALEDDERRRAEELLDRSGEAREELRSFLEVTGALAVAVGGHEPDPALRERILAAARREPGVAGGADATRAAAPAARVLALPRRRRLATPALATAAALAAVVALGLGLYAASLSSDLDATRSALEHQEAAGRVLADPASRTLALASGDGRLVVAGSGEAVLVVDLPAAPAGRTYQVWTIKGADARPAGLFAGGGPSVVPVDGAVTDGAVVAVTVERDGGAEAPTTDPVVASPPV